MTLRHTDPLLATGTGIVLLPQAALGIAALALLVALPATALFTDTITAELRSEMADPSFVFPLLSVIGLIVLALALATLVFLFLENPRRIVRTVSEGDPFMPANARRLTAMAWLMLAVELLTLPMAALGLQMVRIFDAAEAGDGARFGFDFSGLTLVVTPFILARVFRQGAQMRSKPEGTV